MTPFKNSEIFDRYIKGLIMAGLKDDPSNYYKLHKENNMTGPEIRELIFGKTMTGQVSGFSWSIIIDKNGGSEIIAPSGIAHKGKAWIEGDSLCFRSASLYKGLKNCAEIYKNPEGNKKTFSEYLRLADYGLYPFSIGQ